MYPIDEDVNQRLNIPIIDLQVSDINITENAFINGIFD